MSGLKQLFNYTLLPAESFFHTVLQVRPGQGAGSGFYRNIYHLVSILPIHILIGKFDKWADKSTTSYDMLDFKSYIRYLTRKYLVTEPHMLKLKGILLQYLKFD